MMTPTGDEHKKIEAYLGGLRMRLRGIDDHDVSEIIQELRSHILDKAAAHGELTAAGVDSALAALGSPEALAGLYVTDDLLARAEVSRSPVRIIESAYRWASGSIAGFFVLLGSAMGYFLGVASILCAVSKPFHPQTAGLWISRDNAGGLAISLRLGFGSVSTSGKEVLGWWIMPIGLLVGCSLVMLTTRFALWCLRRYRRSRVLPPRMTLETANERGR